MLSEPGLTLSQFPLKSCYIFHPSGPELLTIPHILVRPSSPLLLDLGLRIILTKILTSFTPDENCQLGLTAQDLMSGC